MARYYKKSRRYNRTARPTDRKIKAGTQTLSPVPSGGTMGSVPAYVFTATEPLTARNIKLDIGLSASSGTTIASTKCVYALVIAREGYSPNQLNWPALSEDLYNPTMDVLISGVITGTNDDHKINRIGRKMKPGDRMVLLMGNPSQTGNEVGFELSWTNLH